jgi:hypothetical protein
VYVFYIFKVAAGRLSGFLISFDHNPLRSMYDGYPK